MILGIPKPYGRVPTPVSSFWSDFSGLFAEGIKWRHVCSKCTCERNREIFTGRTLQTRKFHKRHHHAQIEMARSLLKREKSVHSTRTLLNTAKSALKPVHIGFRKPSRTQDSQSQTLDPQSSRWSTRRIELVRGVRTQSMLTWLSQPLPS